MSSDSHINSCPRGFSRQKDNGMSQMNLTDYISCVCISKTWTTGLERKPPGQRGYCLIKPKKWLGIQITDGLTPCIILYLVSRELRTRIILQNRFSRETVSVNHKLLTTFVFSLSLSFLCFLFVCLPLCVRVCFVEILETWHNVLKATFLLNT